MQLSELVGVTCNGNSAKKWNFSALLTQSIGDVVQLLHPFLLVIACSAFTKRTNEDISIADAPLQLVGNGVVAGWLMDRNYILIGTGTAANRKSTCTFQVFATNIISHTTNDTVHSSRGC